MPDGAPSPPVQPLRHRPHIVCRTDVGLRREKNEDHFAICPEVAFCVVADGMGGHVAGEIASHMAIDALESRAHALPGFDDHAGVEDDGRFLSEAIAAANRGIFERGESDAKLRDMGTTIVAAMFRSRYLVFANVGDSRLYRLRDGQLGQLTCDHSWVGELIRKNLLSKKEAMYHPLKNIITRALGMALVVEIDVQCEPVQPGDLYLLCTDGLTDLVGDGDIYGILSDRTLSLAKKADALVAQANESGGLDNITVGLAWYRADDSDESEDSTQDFDLPASVGAAGDG